MVFLWDANAVALKVDWLVDDLDFVQVGGMDIYWELH